MPKEFLLFFQIFRERLFEEGERSFNKIKNSFNVVLGESENDKDRLYVDFDDRFSDSSSTKEGPKGDGEVATGDSGEVKKGIRNLNQNKTS